MKTIIIAEAGVNHNGNIKLAKKLVDYAAKACVDYIKFQTFKAEKITSIKAKKANYQFKNTIKNQSQFEMLKSLELSDKNHIDLMNYCKVKNIKFLSSAFDVDGLNFLDELGLDIFKVPSGEITNYPYLKRLSEFGKPVIMSTGMANLKEIEQALNILKSGNISIKEITLLHCNTEYPTPFIDVNLKAMLTLKNKFGVNIGYSDHTFGTEVSIAAVAHGAKVIEKHFTLGRDMDGPDHAASLEPHELSYLVSCIRNVELALKGEGEKKPSKSESKNINLVRKSIHLAKNVYKGNKLKAEDLIMLRPGDGISPMKIPTLLNKVYKKDLKANSKLKISDFE